MSVAHAFFSARRNMPPSRAQLLHYLKTFYGATGTDRSGHSAGTPQLGRGYVGDGSRHITLTGLLTTDTITAASTNQPTCTLNGRLSIANGHNVWGVTITRSAVVIGFYPCAEGSGLIAISTTGTLPNGVLSSSSFHTTYTDGRGYDLNTLGYTVADGVTHFADIWLSALLASNVLIPSGAGYQEAL